MKVVEVKDIIETEEEKTPLLQEIEMGEMEEEVEQLEEVSSQTTFNALAPELLLEIFTYLSIYGLASVLAVNRACRNAALDDQLWRPINNQHFMINERVVEGKVNKNIESAVEYPAVKYIKFEEDTPPSSVQSEIVPPHYAMYRESHKADYNKLHRQNRAQFIAVKESNMPRLLALNLTFNDFFKKDGEGSTLFDWAMHRNNQPVLDHFFKIREQIEVIEQILPGSYKKNKLLTLHEWNILCKQSVQNLKLLVKKDDPSTKNIFMRYLFSLSTKDFNARIMRFLFIAIAKDAPNAVEILLSYKPNLTARLTKKKKELSRDLKERGIILGDSYLHIAAKLGNARIVEILIEAGALVDDVNQGQTPLHCAIQQEQVAAANSLLQKKANVNALTQRNATPLLLAIETGNAELVELILAYNPQLATPLTDSNYHKKHFNLNIGDKPIHAAVKMNRPDLVQLLLAAKANIDEPGHKQYTPLHYAIIAGNKEMVAFLIEKGASQELVTRKGHTPLRLAAKKGKAEIVCFLLQQQSRKLGDTMILHRAARRGYSVFIEDMLKLSNGVNALNKQGATPLLFAVEEEHEKVVEVLINYGANPSIPLACSTEYHKKHQVVVGDTPLDVAVKKGLTKIEARLRFAETKLAPIRPFFTAATSGTDLDNPSALKLGS